jgi:hypothetical protein
MAQESYQIQTLDNPHYLHVVLWGRWDNGNNDKIIEGLTTEFAKSPQDAILLDARQQTRETSAGAEFVSAHALAEGWKGRIRRLALLDCPEKRRFNQFFEFVARGLGLVVSVFGDEQEAVDWLTGDGPET